MAKNLSLKDFERQAKRIIEQMRTDAKPFEDDSPAAKAERKRRAKADKFYFFQTYLPHYFALAEADFHHELVGLLDITGTPVAVAAPREHAKSTIVTLGYPLHQICFALRHFIIVVSDTEYQATDFVRFIKLEIEENERIKQDFGDLKGNFGQWADDCFTTKNDVKILARGKGQKVRGLRNRQHRPDLVVMDDIENDQSVRNPKQNEKTLDWIVEAVYPSIDKAGSLFIVGTLLSKKSVLAKLIYDPEYSSWEKRLYQAIKADGSPLWPQRHPVESLNKKKTIMGSVRFNKEYQNDPKDDEGLFREEWFRFYHPSELTNRELSIVSFLDPSVGSGETSDYKALITVGQDSAGIIYVLDAYIRKASIDTLVSVTYNRFAEFKQTVIGIETVAFQKVLFNVFDLVAQQRKQHLPLRGVNHTTNKESRVSRLSAYIERGIIRFQKAHSDQDLLREQLLYFPTPSINDDGPDALEGAVALANVPAIAYGAADDDVKIYHSQRT